MQVKSLPVSEALDLIKDLVPLSYLAERMGMNRAILSQAKAHSVINGKPYYLTEDKTDLLRKTVRDVANQLLDTQLKPQYGDYADQLQELKTTTLNIRTLTTRYLGKSIGWMTCRMTHQPYKDRLGNTRDYYNTFTDTDIKSINKALHAIALDLLALDIQTEYSPEVEESQRLSNMDIQTPHRLKSDDELTETFSSSSLTPEERHQLLEDELACGLL